MIRLARLGVGDIGRTATRRRRQGSQWPPVVRVRWHRRAVAAQQGASWWYADWLSVVFRLAEALGRAAAVRERPLEVLVQISLDGDPTRGGVPDGAELARVVEAVAGQETLRLRGVMAVAPLDWQPRTAFTRLVEIATRLRGDYPEATIISAGMSGDLVDALHCGATHVRIGSALLGMRAPLR